MRSNDIQGRLIVLAGRVVIRWEAREVDLHARQDHARQDEQVYELRHIENEEQGRDEPVAAVQCSHCHIGQVNPRSRDNVYTGDRATGER